MSGRAGSALAGEARGARFARAAGHIVRHGACSGARLLGPGALSQFAESGAVPVLQIGFWPAVPNGEASTLGRDWFFAPNNARGRFDSPEPGSVMQRLEPETGPEVVEMSSTLKKRRMKMNKHKRSKRRKRDRRKRA